MKATATLQIFYVTIGVFSYFVQAVSGQYRHIGCFKDKNNRAIQSQVNTYRSGTPRNDELVRLCQIKAFQAGYSIFGIQAGGECWSDPSASTYNRYGKSSACVNEKLGGQFANAVYITDRNQYKYTKVGCFRDTSHRSIAILEGKDSILDGQYHKRHRAIAKCAQAAWKRGYQVFSVQNGGQCFSSNTAHSTYNKYGKSSNCKSDGEGGPWANDVYALSVNTVQYRYLGCFKDVSHSRAMPQLLHVFSQLINRDVVDLCYLDTLKKDCQAFGVQYGGQCFTGTSAHLTYAKYGKAGNCKNGRGGTWANDVYLVDDPYISVGCYVDSAVDRAMPSFISNYNGVTKSEAVRLCYVDTILRGWNVFGVQNGSSCWSGSKAGQTYNKHGRTSSCTAETSDSLANSVYVINVNRAYMGCEYGWTKYENSCYKLFTSAKSWNGAKDSCKRYGASLVKVETQRKQDFVERFIRAKHSNIDRIWIGLKSFDLFGDYRWADNKEAQFFNWESNHGQYGSIECITMATSSGKWSGRQCYYFFSYMCMKNSIIYNNPAVHKTHNEEGVNIGGVIGGAVGGFIFFICCCCKRKRENNSRPAPTPTPTPVNTTTTTNTNVAGASSNAGSVSTLDQEAASRNGAPFENEKPPAFSFAYNLPPPPTSFDTPDQPPPSYEAAIAMSLPTSSALYSSDRN